MSYIAMNNIGCINECNIKNHHTTLGQIEYDQTERAGWSLRPNQLSNEKVRIERIVRQLL